MAMDSMRNSIWYSPRIRLNIFRAIQYNQDLFRHAEHSVVLTLPYRELDRIAEHFYTFLSENIPLMPHPDWLLGYAKVIDCFPMDPTYWYGEQIVLVYVKRSGWNQRDWFWRISWEMTLRSPLTRPKHPVDCRPRMSRMSAW